MLKVIKYLMRRDSRHCKEIEMESDFALDSSWTKFTCVYLVKDCMQLKYTTC